MCKYVLLISFLFFGFGCQTIKSKPQAMPQAMKGWKKVDKEWFSQYASLKPSTKRNLSHLDKDEDGEIIHLFQCKCTTGAEYKGTRREMLIQSAGPYYSITSQIRGKCAAEMHSIADPNSGFCRECEENMGLTVHSCERRPVRVNYEE